MAFTNPIWLWALTGLLIPVAIHLLSRKEGRVIPLGSIRHIEDTSTTQFKKIKLNEVLLLLVRCLLILWIVFLLSGLHFLSEVDPSEKWLLVEEGLEKDSDFEALIDSLQKDDYEVRYLARDFPRINDEVLINNQESYWSLVEALQQKPLKQVIVLSYNYAARFKGKRVAMPSTIHWIGKTPSEHEFPLASIAYPQGDSVWNRYGVSTAENTKFTTVISPGNVGSATQPDTLEIAIASDQKYAYDAQILLAALKTLQINTPYRIKVQTYPPDKEDLFQDTDWLFWLSDQRPPESKASLVTITNSEQIGKNPIVEAISTNQWQITSRLNEGVALRNNLTIQLAELLLPVKALKDTALQHDRRVLPENMAWNTTTLQAGISPTTTLDNDSRLFWVIVILLTLVGERVLASTRNQ